MKVVIMAGGKGTRIASLNSDVPKPMIPICGKPVLEHQIVSLREQGLTDIILVVGHLGYIIKDYFGKGEKWQVNIEYIIEETPLGTAGALYLLKDIISDDFLLLNGDILFNVNIERFYEWHMKHGGMATIFTHPNNHPHDSGVVFSNGNSLVTKWLHKEDERNWYPNQVNAGLHMLSHKILEEMDCLKKLDLDRDILKPLIDRKELYCYNSPEYVKDMGTPERYFAAEEDLKNNKPARNNLQVKQKAIFLDRDGTINKYVGFLRNIDEFELEDGAALGIKKINNSDYLAIVVSNQPVLARGEVTFDELQEIHDKMQTLLAIEGAYLDGIYYCPHHPTRGFEGEIPELKTECECRKPKPGMLLEAANRFNIDLSKSFMIGDSDNDIEAGKSAGCTTIKIGASERFRCLKEAIDFILD